MAAIEQAATAAQERLPGLKEKCDALSPEAAVDAVAREAWRAAAMEVRQAEEAVALVPLARAELQRRQKARQKVEKDRQPHVAEAERLIAEELEIAARADGELATAFESLREADTTNTQLEAALRRAGRDGSSARFKRWMIESAVMYAAMTAGMPPGSLQLESYGAMALSLARARPLLEVTPRPIERRRRNCPHQPKGITMAKKANKDLRKAADPLGRLADSLSDVQHSLNGLTPAERHIAMRANRRAQMSYLRAVSPQAAAWIDTGPQATDDLVGKAQKLRKRDPQMSQYESLMRAARRAA